MEHFDNGNWRLNLGNICYREMWELGKLLTELGDKGNIGGKTFDLEYLRVYFNAKTGELTLTDGDETVTA